VATKILNDIGSLACHYRNDTFRLLKTGKRNSAKQTVTHIAIHNADDAMLAVPPVGNSLAGAEGISVGAPDLKGHSVSIAFTFDEKLHALQNHAPSSLAIGAQAGAAHGKMTRPAAPGAAWNRIE
jgi:hypothetical protein